MVNKISEVIWPLFAFEKWGGHFSNEIWVIHFLETYCVIRTRIFCFEWIEFVTVECMCDNVTHMNSVYGEVSYLSPARFFLGKHVLVHAGLELLAFDVVACEGGDVSFSHLFVPQTRILQMYSHFDLVALWFSPHCLCMCCSPFAINVFQTFAF